MIQRIVSTATLALAFIGEVSATNKYTLVDDYAGTNFFDMFDFYTVRTISCRWLDGSKEIVGASDRMACYRKNYTCLAILENEFVWYIDHREPTQQPDSFHIPLKK